MERHIVMRCILLCALAAAGVSHAAEPQPPAPPLPVLLGRALAAQQNLRAIESTRDRQLLSARQRLQLWQATAEHLRREPPSDEQADRARAHLHALQRRRPPDEAALAEARAAVETAAVRDVGKRRAMAEALEPQIEKLAGELRTREAPFRAAIRRLGKAHAADREALEAAVRPFVRPPGQGIEPVTGAALEVEFCDALVHVSWRDAGGAELAWADVRFHAEVENTAGRDLLADTFPITSAADGNVCLWAGRWHIVFWGRHAPWKTKEAARQMVQALLDLEGLAALRAGDPPDAVPAPTP
jgi:hypothetical protein